MTIDIILCYICLENRLKYSHPVLFFPDCFYADKMNVEELNILNSVHIQDI